MQYTEGITRAKNLIAKGRYRRSFSKHLEDFKKLDSLEAVTVDQQVYIPYYNTKIKQVIYGYLEQHNAHTLIHYLHFTHFDYQYGAKSDFTWIDRDDYGFHHID